MKQTSDYSAIVAQQLDEFLTHPSKRVLLFKGKWGVGKTHYWTKTYLPDRLRKAGVIEERLYAYVSLFGVESVKDIEQLILVKSVRTGERKALTFIETGLRKAASVADLIPVLKDYQGLVQRVGHIAIRNTLICIDEIERKSTGLSLATVMGLISVLREHNGCRFLLIMNDEQIAGEDLTDFNRYREKIIDETISYTPEVADNTRLFFGGDASSSQYVEVFRRLEVSNIRVMQQVAWAVEHFAPLFLTLEPVIRQQFREHIILLATFFHIPSLGIDVAKLPRDSVMEYFFKKEEDKSAERKREMDRVRRYRYEIQEYDHIIVDYLRDGRCDEDRLRILLEEANNNERQGQIYTKFQALWNPYNRSFAANATDVLSAFTIFLNNYAAQLSFSQLWEVLRLTDALGARSQRRKWIDAWIAPRISRSTIKGLRDLAGHCRSKRLKHKIREQEKRLRRKTSLLSLITKVVDVKGWSPETVGQLDSFRTEDFRRAFLKHDEEHFLSALHEFCEMWKQSGVEEKAVEKKIEDALLSIAKTSRLNQMRVRLIIPWAFPANSGGASEVTPNEPEVEN